MLGVVNINKANRFAFLFVLFIIGVTFYGSVSIGPITVRNIVTVLMLISCICHYKGMWIDGMFIAYVAFVIFNMLSVLFDPYSDTVEFFTSKLFGYFLPCYVAYFATYIYIVKLGQSPKPIIITLLLAGTLSAIVSILQFLQLNSVWNKIFSILFLPLPTYFDRIEGYDLENTLGYYTTGIFQKAVINGYFLCMVSILSFYFLQRRTRIKERLLFIVFFLINLMGLFVCQERSSFFLGLLGSSYLLYHSIRKSSPIFMLFLLVATYLFVKDVNVELEELGRLSNLSYSYRGNMNNNSVNFITSNLLLGGLEHYVYLYKIPPHNIIYNAFIYSGLFGGVILLGIFFRQCWICCKNSLSVHRNYELAMVSVSLLAYQSNSFAHNSSLVTGDVTIWLLWGVIVFGYCHKGFKQI